MPSKHFYSTAPLTLTDEQMELFNRHIGLVDWIVYTRAGNSPHVDDIKQQCYIAYIRCVQHYKEGLGAKFTTYATMRLKYEVMAYRRGSRSEKPEPYLYSLDLQGGEFEDGGTLAEAVPDPSVNWDDVDKDIDFGGRLNELLDWCRRHLDETDVRIIEGLAADKSQTQIAEEIGITRSSISFRVKRMREGVTHRGNKWKAIPWSILTE